MEKKDLRELRSLFLRFFEEKDHIVMHSFPLIPKDDHSLLLINAGMAPLKKYFTGEAKFAKDRVATSQKCIRTQDIENVGRTQRHAAFFEMLGNFSFGDYFKKEAIEWGMEFLTEWLGIPRDRLWATVYEDDDEAYELWQTVGGLPKDRIERLGKETNFWELEVGPCGPCSEIFVDRGVEYTSHPGDTSPAGDGERFLEVWNLVFTQFDRQPDGSYLPLAKPNIDTGMGLERLALVMQEADNIFELSDLKGLIRAIEDVTHKRYKENEKDDVSIRVLVDHSKAMAFLIGDGVLPSNEGRGYVLRRLMRRALRHGILLGVEGKFLTPIVDKVIEIYEEAYPELRQRRDMIVRIVESEEEKFQKTVIQGMELLSREIAALKQAGAKELSGETTFKLYDTYGFPIDLTREVLEEEGLAVDESGFTEAMNAQRTRSREHGMHGSIGWEAMGADVFRELPATEFLGYDHLTAVATIDHIYRDQVDARELSEGETGVIVTNQSPFYGEGGGQVGDSGILWSSFGRAVVTDTKKTSNGAILHTVQMEEGVLKTYDEINLSVDGVRRGATMKNHSATHLLHQALRIVLGDHVEQAGSYVDDARLRFDFTHFSALTKEEIEAIEAIVNERIADALAVDARNMSLEEANAEGAVGLFEEKYKDVVRVLSMGDFSKELCGGTHVANTAQIQMFRILSESGVSAGIRRIEAVTGKGVYELLRSKEQTLAELANVLKSQPRDVVEKTAAVLEENRQLQREMEKLRAAQNVDRVGSILQDAREVEGIQVATAKVEGLNTDELRDLADRLRDKMGSGAVALAGVTDDRLQFVVALSKDLAGKTLHAGKIVKEMAQLAGGNGGGRPDMATAGGKEVEKADFALQSVCDIIKKQLSE